MNYGWKLVTFYRKQEPTPSQEKEMQKAKMVAQEGLTNSCEKKRNGKKRRNGKIQASEFRVPKTSKEG